MLLGAVASARKEASGIWTGDRHLIAEFLDYKVLSFFYFCFLLLQLRMHRGPHMQTAAGTAALGNHDDNSHSGGEGGSSGL